MPSTSLRARREHHRLRRALVAVFCAVACTATAQTVEPTSGSGPAASPPTASASSVGVRMGEHPVVTIGKVNVAVRARVETSLRRGSPAEDGVDADWRRRRVQLEASYEKLEFEFSHEFGDPDEPERDAFVNLKLSRPFELQAGRFKVPFGRDALKSGANLDFVSRSLLGRQLAPGRDVGVMAHGRVGRSVAYQGGYFLHDGDNARAPDTDGGDHEVAGRVEVTPFASRRRSALEDLELGVAVTRSHADRALGLRGQTVFGDGVLFDRAFVNGSRWRQGFDAAWSRGPVGASAEYARTHDSRARMGLVGEDLPALTASSWYVAGSWVVTGERKRARVEPRRAIHKGGAGAVELAIRLEHISFGAVSYPGGAVQGPRTADLAANGERVVTLGASWFPHPRVKVQGNIVRESVDNASRSPAPRNSGRFTSGILNFQFVL